MVESSSLRSVRIAATRGMGEIRIARRALLLAMGLHGIDVARLSNARSCWGCSDEPLNQIVLSHHLRLRATPDFTFFFITSDRQYSHKLSAARRALDSACVEVVEGRAMNDPSAVVGESAGERSGYHGKTHSLQRRLRQGSFNYAGLSMERARQELNRSVPDRSSIERADRSNVPNRRASACARPWLHARPQPKARRPYSLLPVLFGRREPFEPLRSSSLGHAPRHLGIVGRRPWRGRGDQREQRVPVVDLDVFLREWTSPSLECHGQISM